MSTYKSTELMYSRRVDNFDDFLDCPEDSFFYQIGEDMKKTTEEPAPAPPGQQGSKPSKITYVPTFFRKQPEATLVSKDLKKTVVRVEKPPAPAPQKIELPSINAEPLVPETKKIRGPSLKTRFDVPNVDSAEHDGSFMRSWKKNSASCSACLTIVPHNQLFVCVNSQCNYNLKQKSSIRTPQEFYRKEKVFCGCCSFRGNHSAHADEMQPACQLAIEIASGEVGEELEEKFNNLITLHDTEPVDYMMAEMRDTTRLDKMDVVAYLKNSADSVEWNSRFDALNDTLAKINTYRLQGRAFVVEKAKQIAALYSSMSKAVAYNLEMQVPGQQDTMKRRLLEHLPGMGIEVDSEEATRVVNRQYGSSNSASSKSSYSSESSAFRSQADIYDALDQEVDPSPVLPPITPELVKTTYRSLVRRFEIIRDEMALEDALLDVSLMLDEKNATMEHKIAAAQMFRDRNNMQLYWPIEDKE